MGCGGSKTEPFVKHLGQSEDLRKLLLAGQDSGKSLPETPILDLTTVKGDTEITGLLWAELIKTGFLQLSANRNHCNKINVFPIPDGDTGNNMVASLKNACNVLCATPPEDIKTCCSYISQQSILSALGNSGTIFTFLFTNLFREVEQMTQKKLSNSDRLTIKEFGACCKKVAGKMNEAMGKASKDGTMLSVVRDTFNNDSIKEAANIKEMCDRMLEGAKISLAKTPDQLKVNGRYVLRDAGVVDSGAQGFVYLMEGMVMGLEGKLAYTREQLEQHQGEVAELELEDEGEADVEAEHQEMFKQGKLQYRFCTEVVVELKSVDTTKDHIRSKLMGRKPLGDSFVLVHNKLSDNVAIAKIHIHSNKPEEVFEALRGMSKDGFLYKEKAEDMKQQLHRYMHPRTIPGMNDKVQCAVVFTTFANLPEDFYGKWMDTNVVPMGLTIDAGQYKDRIDQDQRTLGNIIRRHDYDEVGTSGARTEQIYGVIKRHFTERSNVNEVLFISMPKAMSGATFNNFAAAEKQLTEEGHKIVHYQHRGFYEGFAAMRAMHLSNQGLGAQAIIDDIHKVISGKDFFVAVVSQSIGFLRKGGRLNHIDKFPLNKYLDSAVKNGNGLIGQILCSVDDKRKPGMAKLKPKIPFAKPAVLLKQLIGMATKFLKKSKVAKFDMILSLGTQAHQTAFIVDYFQTHPKLRHVYVTSISTLMVAQSAPGVISCEIWPVFADMEYGTTDFKQANK